MKVKLKENQITAIPATGRLGALPASPDYAADVIPCKLSRSIHAAQGCYV